ncbi:MAG: hypothetical protein IH946_07530 [Bacteroidetes bacterium]|nr:hypothetical protein [Bacteroidota bacterium]
MSKLISCPWKWFTPNESFNQGTSTSPAVAATMSIFIIDNEYDEGS